MATSIRLLPAVLLALAACKLSTADLEPKTVEECAAVGRKACGYKCVSLDDPTTGCSAAGCSDPCPALPDHMVPGCTPVDQLCSWSCAQGWSDCDLAYGNGCEVNVGGSDRLNCGACGRACPNGCNQGLCVPDTVAAPGEPRGILYDGSTNRVYWMDDGAYGEMMCWDPTAVVSYAVAKSFDPRAGSPAVFRLAMEQSAAAAPKLYATGAVPDASSSTGYGIGVFQVDPGGVGAPVTAFQAAEAFGGERFQGLAASRGGVFWTREGGTPGPCFVVPPPTGGPPNPISCTFPPGASDVRGLLAVDSTTLLFGYPENNGTLSNVDNAFNEQPLYRNIGSWPSRIAFYRSSTGVGLWFWADESNGDVWAAAPGPPPGTPVLVDFGTGSATLMDIAADGWGVVWTDYVARKVRAWRAPRSGETDGAMFDLALGAEPLGVTMSPTDIYWTDSRNNTVYRVPKGSP